MRGRGIIGTLLALMLVLTLLPVTAFARESTEKTPACVCETPCTAENMNADCPVCGAEGALPENCAKYIDPANDALTQPEGEPAVLNDEGGNTPLNGTASEVSSAADLVSAMADPTVGTVKLTADIDISSTLTVTRAVILDLNGNVLRMVNNENDPVIEVKKGSYGFGIGYLRLTDSDSSAVHKFTPNADGLWVLDETNGTKTVNGGVITGRKNMGIFVDGCGTPNPTEKPAEAVCAHLIMTGGNIVGCMTERNGGGVCAARHAYFTMTGGSIRGCVAKVSGGGVSLSWTTVFNMDGSALIADCVSTGSTNSAGGGIDAYSSSVTLSGNAAIQNCTAELGGGVNLDSTYLTMFGNAAITSCTATNGGGGVYTSGIAGDPTGNTVVFTMKDASSIVNCTALKGGGVFFMTSSGVMSLADSAKIENCRAIEREGLSIPDVNGGGVLVVTGRLEISGGSITDCTAAKGDNSVFTEASGGFTMTGGSVDGSIRLTYKNGNNTVYMDGLGTAAYPYEIGTADQLKTFRDIVNGANGQTQNPAACAKLTNDIVLNDGTFDENGNYTPGPSGKAVETWTPIAYSGLFDENTTLYYTGTFDGQGHTIRGLYVSVGSASSIEDQVCLGLFSTAKNAVIRNVTVTGYVFGFAGNLGGIVGYLSGGTIENCANHCTVKSTLAATEGPSYIGGIAGGADSNATIRDCYNTGTITVDKYLAWNSTGGIVGYNNSSEVSNCYNIGNVAGNGWYNGEIVGNNADDENGNHSTVNNCYYLDGTGRNAVGSEKGSITNTESKTAAQFADGTVLALLINGRADNAHPWNSECQYLAAVDRTLPVFKGQGDTHTHQSGQWATSEPEHWKVCACGAVFDKAAHSGTDDGDCTTAMTCACGHTTAAAKDHTWGAWTSNDDGTHTRRCTVGGCTKGTETANCSGGKATCSAKAQCAVCGAAYGPLDPNAHGSGLKHTPARAATTSHQGNIEYWHCANCGKFFSDAAATRVITLADTVIEKLRHSGVTRRYPAATGQPDASGTGKTIKSQDTGDAGVALYAATALLSLTGAAWLTGKKRG